MTTVKKMTKSLIFSLLIGSSLSGCSAQNASEPVLTDSTTTEMTVVGDIPLPPGYSRVEATPKSFGSFLRNLSLKEDNTVYLYDGSRKGNQSAQFAVLDVDVGKRDLQQCADAVMRLRAEYLFEAGKHDQIAFHFTSGHLARWTAYASGYRARISGNQVSWVKTASPDSSYGSFRQYMNLVFSYCGTRSMDKEVARIAMTDIQPGDVFHQTGNPYGHAVTVMDVAVDSSGNKVFLLAQCYMPAQSIHILKNPNDNTGYPWYRLKDGQELVTPEWTFPANSLKRWK